MEFEKLMERQTILQLAMQEAFRKKEECQVDFDELDSKLCYMTAKDCSFQDRDKVVDSMVYLKSCIYGWQETIDNIREWQDELKMQ